MQNWLGILTYAVIFGAFIFTLLLWLANDRIKMLRNDVNELQKVRWEHEHKFHEQLMETRREVWDKIASERSELQKQIAALREQIFGKGGPEKIGQLARDFFDKEIDDRLGRMEKSLREMEKHERDERMRRIDEALERNRENLAKLRQPKPPEGTAN